MASVVPKLWPGETFVCIASGPSLTDADVDFVRGKARVIVVNDNYKKAPWADVLYAADGEWWAAHDGVTSFTGLKYGLTPPTPTWAKTHPISASIQLLKPSYRGGLEHDPQNICTGGEKGSARSNSGFQAINIAVHLGATRILLLGYDMKRNNGKLHWFGNHPDDLHRNPPLSEFVKSFPTLLTPLQHAGIAIVNCSRVSAIECFERQPIDQALAVSVAA